ncbi:MAG TPA: hypothetical protein VGB20_02155 [bacterium]
MDTGIRQRLVQEIADIQMREILTFFFRDHPEGAEFEALKEMLFLHESFEESRLSELVGEKVLAFDGRRYKLSTGARQVLERDPTILLDELIQ